MLPPVGQRARQAGVLSDRAQLLAPLLQRNEQMLWIGSPDPMKVASHLATHFIVGAIFVTGSVLMLHGMFMRIGPRFSSSDSNQLPFLLFFALWGGFVGVFGLVGIGIATAPVLAFRIARRTVYSITTQRALICTISHNAANFANSYPITPSTRVMVAHSADETGTIVFSFEGMTYPNRSNSVGLRWHLKNFIGIKNIANAERVLRDAIANSEPNA
jgi:hypothetical protein